MTLGETLRHEARFYRVSIGISDIVIWKTDKGWDAKTFLAHKISKESHTLYEPTKNWLREILMAHPDAVVLSKERGDLAGLVDIRSAALFIKRIHKNPGKFSIQYFLETANVI